MLPPFSFLMEVRKYVNKSSILERVNQYDIFKAYITNFKELGVKFRSELRYDKNPTCMINKYGDKLLYRDFSTNDKLDCFGYIMQKYTVTFPQCLEMINQDFKLKLISKTKINYTPKEVIITDFNINEVKKTPTIIEVQLRDWNLNDKKFWKDKYNITIAELKNFRVFPLLGFWINDRYFRSDMCSYGYYMDVLEDGRLGWKIYQPNSVHLKWITNCPETVFQGYNQLPLFGNTLIITKSLKDVIVLSKVGYYATAPQGETIVITKDFMNLLKRRFNRIVLLYDNDVPGIKATKIILDQHNIPHLYMPGDTKDVSDFVEKYGYDELENLIQLEWIQEKQIIKY